MYLINNGDILYDHNRKCYLNLKYDPYDLKYYNCRKYAKATPVEVSDELYEYLKYKSLHTTSDLIFTDRFKAKSLSLNFADIDIPTHHVDIINQYVPITKDSISPMKVIQEDNIDIDTTGLYTGLSDYALIYLTNIDVLTYKLKYVVGTSDNATQVKDFLQKAIDTYIFENNMNKKLFVTGKSLVNNIKKYPNEKYTLTFTYIKNDHTKDLTNNWRWHNNNDKLDYVGYIGKHKITTEYLNDDKDIDYILKWRLLPVNITDK